MRSNPDISAPESGEPAADDRRLLERYHEHGDVHARQELIERRLPLARRLAYRYSGSQEPTDDLVQVASLGLVKAVDRYDMARTTSFSTFAVPTILGELKRHFRDHGYAVHVPRPVQELSLKVRHATETLHTRLGRSPTTSELARELEADVEQVIEALEASQAMSPRSLDAPTTEDGDEEGAPAGELIGTLDDRFEIAEDLVSARSGIVALTGDQRKILWMRFFEDRTQADIARELGVSQMQVSRLIRRALDNVRATIDADDVAA